MENLSKFQVFVLAVFMTTILLFVYLTLYSIWYPNHQWNNYVEQNNCQQISANNKTVANEVWDCE